MYLAAGDYTVRTRTTAQGASTTPSDFTQIASVTNRTGVATWSQNFDTLDFTAGTAAFDPAGATSASVSTGVVGRYLIVDPGAGVYNSIWEIQVAGSPAPEPSAVMLLVTALIGLLAYTWRKRR